MPAPTNSTATNSPASAATGIIAAQPDGAYAQQRGVVEQLLARVRTAYLVRVVAVTRSGAAARVGTVDVQPPVGQLDGSGNVVEHGVITGFRTCGSRAAQMQ
ncbi:hypothetical protein [Paraburkholderia heleia]|uniref:hypothetical protein n=1 Tax=Paraburkholderia heleia TaxID=634127 RepID=UPI002AB61062|nr:hypothetical protein [Paraburkholderia heleia]